MDKFRSLVVFLIIFSVGCKRTSEDVQVSSKDEISDLRHYNYGGKGALLLTKLDSLSALKEVVDILYTENIPGSVRSQGVKNRVQLTHHSGGREVVSILQSGISQADFLKARNGTVWDRVLLGLKCPFVLLNKSDLGSIESLGRRRPWLFGKGDVAFYDLAETMAHHIREEDTISMSVEDLSEKGYLNTFNHITAQAFMTSAFSESMADFVADVHELYNMPELITGKFTETQLADITDGPVDNYVDMINNEWGQELGKVLATKYTINHNTYWTPELLTAYLNDIQSYYSWSFEIGFKPFKATDEIVVRFADKINKVIKD